MTKLALPGNVAGKFDGSTILSDGLEYKVFRKASSTERKCRILRS